MLRTLKPEWRVAILCALLGADIDPDFTLWTMRLADLVSAGVAVGIAVVIVWAVVELTGLSGLWTRRETGAAA